MPTFIYTAPSGRRIKVTADQPPTEDQLKVIFEQAGVLEPTEATEEPRTMLDTATDVATGFGKGAVRSALGLGEAVHAIPGVTSAVDALYGVPGLSDRAFEEGEKATEYTNTPQMIGGGLETVAEMAIPITKAAQAVPNAARAGRKFQSVMSAAKNVPVDVNGPGQVALRINQLADRGGTMPVAVRKFLNRATDPNKAAMTYEEARDFASNISRLSANEYGRLTPVLAREVATLRVTLNKAVADAAKAAGKGAEYRSAMREYANAMRIRDLMESAWEGAKKTAPFASAVGAGYWLTNKLKNALGGE